MAFITEAEFINMCTTFVKASDSLRDGWRLVSDDILNLTYATKKFCKLVKPRSKKDNTSGVAVNFDCHIVYSNSYSNPVFYFTACDLEGKPLTLLQCWDLVDQSYQHNVQENNKWSFITEQEHPILLRPFFQLHPCHTDKFMAPLKKATPNYILSWLSVVLPCFQLDFNINNYVNYFDHYS